MNFSNHLKGLTVTICLIVSVLPSSGQVSTTADPDSVFGEWLEAAEWEGVSLHPDIAMDWLLDADSSPVNIRNNRRSRMHLFTVNMPAGASLDDRTPDSGRAVSPVTMKYRFRISEPHHWEFRLQACQNAGDTFPGKPENGVPRQVSSGLLISPGNIFKDVIAGDFQVNSGFGVVAGSSPVFSIALGNPGLLHRAGKGIRLHSGTDQGRFFRGVAIAMESGRSEFLVYGSGKDLINEEVAGVGWKTSFSNAAVGFSGIGVNSQFPPEIRDGWTSVWQPDSGRYSRMGIWGQLRLPFGIVFGEAGWSPAGGYGWLTGIRWFESHGFSAITRYSGCTPGYPVTYSLFQSGSGLTREGQRIISSFRYSPVRKFEWLGSVEAELSAWPGSNSRFSNSTTRIYQQLKYFSARSWMVSASAQLNFIESAGSVPQKLTWKLAFDSDPRWSGSLRFRAGFRQQAEGFDGFPGKGTTTDCNLGMFLFNRKLRIICGFRVFTVESGTDPLYAYEPDVLYGWSAPVLSGSGTRWFAVLRWKLGENLDLEIKSGQTAYSDLKHFMDENHGGFAGKVQVSWRKQ
jgi:hypothetical protein